jgi:hypothetical protein
MINAKIYIIPLFFDHKESCYKCVISNEENNHLIYFNIEPNLDIDLNINHTLLKYINSDITIFNNKLTDLILNNDELNIYYLSFITHECSLKNSARFTKLNTFNFPINAQKIINLL